MHYPFPTVHLWFQSALKAHQNELARIAAEEEDTGGHPRSLAQIRRAKSSLDSSIDVSNGTQGETADIGTVDDVAPDIHPTSLASLCPPESSCAKINTICSWRAAGQGEGEDEIRGEHHLTQLLVRPLKKSRGCPVTITAKHPTNVSHNFAKGPVVRMVVGMKCRQFRHMLM